LNAQIVSEEERLADLRSESNVTSGFSPEARLVELKLALVSQLALHTDEHPSVVATRRQIEQLETNLGEVKKIMAESETQKESRVASAMRSLEHLRKQAVAIDVELEKLDRRANQIPANAEALGALTQNSRVLEENYLEFLRKVQDSKLAEELERSQQGPRVSVLDRATRPNQPIRSVTQYLQLGILASIGLAIAAALLAELLDPAVLSSQHFEYVGEPRVLGTIYTL
jgi:myosin heavy subunit